MGPNVEHIANRLLEWGAGQRRDLPWRSERDPYRVWVAVVMLQQTRRQTVAAYYRRFLARFPTVGDLARADVGQVLKVWEGLGYYARARHLHAAARRVVAEHGGQLPSDAAALRALPGIGDYTAGAILSLAFGADVPALDGNAYRVLCRLFAVEDDPRRAGTRRRLWALAEGLLPRGQAGPFNVALMDLGATVCVPRAPRCHLCPVAAFCAARRRGLEGELPVRPPRRELPHYDVTAGVIWRDGRVLIAQRPAEGMLGGLWEFPGGKCEDGETLPDCLRREIREELGIEIAVGAPLTVVRHAYSHFRITLHAFTCRHLSGEPRALGCAAWRWVRPDELHDFAFPVTDQRIIAVLNIQ